MTVHSLRTLLLLAATATVPACSSSKDEGSDAGCADQSYVDCVPRADAWAFVQSKSGAAGGGGIGGASSSTGGSGGGAGSGAAGAGALPDGCPSMEDALAYQFQDHFKLRGYPQRTLAPTQDGESCCYTTHSAPCLGRALVVAEAVVVARAMQTSAWA